MISRSHNTVLATSALLATLSESEIHCAIVLCTETHRPKLVTSENIDQQIYMLRMKLFMFLVLGNSNSLINIRYNRARFSLVTEVLRTF